MSGPKELVKKWIEIFNLADAGRLAAMYAGNAVNHQVPLLPVEGRKAIQNMFEEEFSHAKMVCNIENIFEDGNGPF